MAFEVRKADPDVGMTPDVVMHPRHQDAAFPIQDHPGRCPDDLWSDIGPCAIDGVEAEHHDA
jgi:hypothetical protein